jgi:polyhydroxyalkanoate synthesis regulator phasin
MSDNAPDMNKILFANLIMMLSSSAMQQLGKLVNPMTNKTELNLEGARMTIDMLEMMQAKSKGNLDEEEEKMMKEILSTVQMNYVETSENPPAEEKAEEADAKPEDAPAVEEKTEAPEESTEKADEPKK